MRFIFTILAALVALPTQADELLVPAQYPTVQAAIDAAANGDVITISPGTYREYLDTLGKAVTLRSTDPDDPSVVASTVLSADTDLDGIGESCVLWAISGETLATTIDGLTITEGRYPFGAAILAYDSSITVRRCRIVGNKCTTQDNALGGAVMTFAGSIAAEDCTFDDNRCERLGRDLFANSGDLVVTRCAFLNSSQSTDSGSYAISAARGGDATLTDCTFDTLQGAIGIIQANTVEVSDCTFDACTSPVIEIEAEILTFLDTTITNSSDGSSGIDSAVYLRGSISALVERSLFAENHVSEFFGTLQLVGPDCVLRDSDFIHNTTDRFSGVGIVAGRSLIENCTFERNSGQTVGALECSAGDHTLRNCVFRNNSSDEMGAFFIGYQGDVRVFDSLFIGNTGGGNGGAIQTLTPSEGHLSGCTFISNHSDGFGGAIFADRSFSFSIDACHFYGNTALRSGGAVYTASRSGLGPQISNSIFVENESSESGGAIASSLGMVAVNNTFVHNNAPSAPTYRHSARRIDFANNLVLSDAAAPLDFTGATSDSVIGHSIIPGGYTGPGTATAITDILPSLARLPDDGGDGWGDDPATTGVDESLNDDFGDLTPTSVEAIDAGSNAAIPLDRYDLDNDGDSADQLSDDALGNPRQVDIASVVDTGLGDSPVVDIGAIEVAPAPCQADVNQDGTISPADFTAWIVAFNTQAPECDQNSDGSCTPADFTAWISNYNVGCQ